VYVFADACGGVTCCSCLLVYEGKAVNPGYPRINSFNCATAAEMAEHLRQHQEAGHRMPEWLIEEILDDADFIESDESTRYRETGSP
jgi:hypothetical protein